MEQSSILGEEDSLYRLIRGIILTHLNLRQRGAARESIFTDGGDRIGDDYLLQRFAAFESPLPNGGDPTAKSDSSQRGAVGESIVTNGGDRIGDNNLRQRFAGVESPLPNGGDRIGDDNLR